MVGFGHEANVKVSVDEKLSVGCMLMEYLMPLMEDPYYLEGQILQFLSELATLKKAALTNATFRVFELSFSDEYLGRWTQSLMQCCCKRLVQQNLQSSFNYGSHLSLVREMLSRDKFRAAWL